MQNIDNSLLLKNLQDNERPDENIKSKNENKIVKLKADIIK